MSGHLRSIAALVVLVVLGVSTTLLAQEAPRRGIVQIAPGLYRAQNNIHYTVFLVTPEGIIMSDPINREFSTWLRSEMQTRFPNRPVRFVLYTHHDWDHASGGAVWADTAQFVAHANFPQTLQVPDGNLALPENARKLDANGNGRLERGEARENLLTQFTLLDANKDLALSGGEIARGPLSDVFPPTITYSADRHALTLGGKTVVMIALGSAHAIDSSVLYFPSQRVAFSADIMQVKRLPGGVAPTVGAWLDAVRTIEKLDFDIAATGHALSGRKQDVVELRQYLEELSVGVAAGIGAGRSLADIQKTLTLDKYKAWERYDTNRTAHIAQVYATMMGTPAPTP